MNKLLMPYEKKEVVETLKEIISKLETNEFRCELEFEDNEVEKLTFYGKDVKSEGENILSKLEKNFFTYELEFDKEELIKATFYSKDIVSYSNALKSQEEVVVDNKDTDKEFTAYTQVNEKVTINSETDLLKYISKLLIKLGVPAHIKGYEYIREAMLMLYKDGKAVNYITKELYPEIAKKYKTNTCSVERTIRHAIQRTHENSSNSEIFKEIFGSSKKPTNFEFIILLYEYIQFHIE